MGLLDSCDSCRHSQRSTHCTVQKSVFEQYRCRLGGRVVAYEMPAELQVEIDTPDDWIAVEVTLNYQP